MTDAPHTLFAGVELARRIERAERSLIEQAATGSAAAEMEPIAGGSAVWAGEGSPFSKVVGVGLDGSPAGDEFDRVEAMFARHGCATQFEIPTLADPGVTERLSRRGYRLAGFENVLGLPLDRSTAHVANASVDVRGVDLGDIDDHGSWLRVDVEASATPDTMGVASHEVFSTVVVEQAVRALSATDGFVAAVASIDGVPAGSGSLRLCDGVAQLCGAATLPAFRRRGVQSALLSTRLAWASEAGCDLVVVTVQPGSMSQQNVQRLGFQLLYARAILVRELDGSSVDDAQFLDDRIYEHNAAAIGCDDGHRFVFHVRDEQNRIVAGIDGWTWAQACQIDNLWVRADLRGSGHGKALLERAEQEARQRGCVVVSLNSYSFQSPAFYERFGYEVVHRLVDFPPGHSDTRLVKRLRPPD